MNPKAVPLPYDEYEARAVADHFDAAYYLRKNPDVREAGVDPLDHFLTNGWREGRNPSPDFDVRYYLRTHTDVAAAGINPVLHYAWSGAGEGRLTRRPMDSLRSLIESARHPRDKAREWVVEVDRSECLEGGRLDHLLANAIETTNALVVAVSHDDYLLNLGGVQNVIRQEQSALEHQGFAYLHLSPAFPKPLLAEPEDAADFLFSARLGSDRLGFATLGDLANSFKARRRNGAHIVVVVHHLQGHAPEAIRELAAIASHGTVAWIHDYFALCANYNLLRNDVRYCGAPPAASGACNVCIFGDDRDEHQLRIRRFFEATKPVLLAPSESALALLRNRGALPCREARVQPLARLVLASEQLPERKANRPLRVAHLGMRVHPKGWSVFEVLARRFAKDPAYRFFQLGLPIGADLAEGIDHIDVRVTKNRPNAMVESIVEHGIDVVVNWSIWPETFCYTVHEALAAGAFVLANAGAGHVAAALRALAPEQGRVLESEAELLNIFEDGRLTGLVHKASCRRGFLIPGSGSAAWVARMLEREDSPSRSGKQIELASNG